MKLSAKFTWISIALALILVSARIAKSERLPIKTYTTADGLAHNNVRRIVRDSRGFLWFCTFEGLSRFDGYGFTNYGVEHGLPSQVVSDLLETRDGHYWVATDAGVCAFNPKGIPGQQATTGASESLPPSSMFSIYYPGDEAKSKQITSLLQDRAGAVWCGTARGLYRLEEQDGRVEFRFIELGMPAAYGEARNVTSLTEDQRGALWIGSMNGIYRLLSDGRTAYYGDCNGVPFHFVRSLLADREGRVWVTPDAALLFSIVTDPDPTRPLRGNVYSTKDGLPFAYINYLFQAADGSLWAGSSNGLIRFVPTADGGHFRFRVYGLPHGLSSVDVQALAQDRSGNLWVATANGGAAKLARSGITAYGEADGLKNASAIFKDRAEGLNVITVPNDKAYLINRFDGERFTAIRLKFPQPTYFGWGWNQLVLQDRAGEWWAASGQGLYRFPKVSRFERLGQTLPSAVYTTRDGLASNDILRLFEDSRGDIWVATANRSGISRWDRATETFHHYGEKDGLPSLVDFYPISFCEDRVGAVWIGFNFGGGLVRFRDGRFTRLSAAEGLPQGGIFNLFLDSAGRLWVPTTRGGVCRIDHPEAEDLQLTTYTTAVGLSSNDVKAVTEDRWGRIYLGTGRGIDRLDPASNHMRHYTANEGALLGDVQAALADRDGALWFSYTTGLVRLEPEPNSEPDPPPVLITGLRIAGDTQPVSALGETEVAPIELAADRNQLQIDFVALGFSAGEGLRYQYRLEGTAQDWSVPSDQRTVNFANAAAGRYRFLVRAINADGVLSNAPASVAFTIRPPLWRRWWFIAMTVGLVCIIAYGLYRYRVARLLELERVRTRIATDLHDDIGSSLSQIAIMSEVIQQRVDGDNQHVGHPLAVIASTSRELVDSMADIVWAINPQRDHLIDLTQRMRQFASDLVTSRNLGLTFVAPGLDNDIPLETDIRREVFLIFKEAVNNAVRHSNCSAIDISFCIADSGLNIKVVDDGSGFDAARSSAGHGLASIRRRAESIGGRLEVVSQTGRGTTIILQAPLRHRRLRRMKIAT